MTASFLAPAAAAVAVAVLLQRWVRPIPTAFGARRSFAPQTGTTAAALPPCPAWFRRAAEQADLAAPTSWWWGSLMVVGAAGMVGALAGGFTLAILAGPGTAAALLAGLRANSDRREKRVARSVPDALDSVARSCRSGASILQALHGLDPATAGPAAAVFNEVAARVERGDAFREALDDVVGHHRVSALRLAAAALLVGADTGAAPARAVEGVALTLRDRAALEREAAAHATQARASAAVLVLAPVGFGIFAVTTDPRVGEFLFRTPLGLVCLTLGVALDLVGAWWMVRLVRRAR